jgi:hypothetical protein
MYNGHIWATRVESLTTGQVLSGAHSREKGSNGRWREGRRKQWEMERGEVGGGEETNGEGVGGNAQETERGERRSKGRMKVEWSAYTTWQSFFPARRRNRQENKRRDVR